MTSGIYQIRNIKNNKVYVGQTINFRDRFNQHKSSLLGDKHYNKYLQRSFNKYGIENFVFEVLEYCPKERLNEKEREWIKYKRSEYAEYGYNAAYAVIKFGQYDTSLSEINVTNKTINLPEMTDEIRHRISLASKRHFSDVNNRIEHSLRCGCLEEQEIIQLKDKLSKEYKKTLPDISEETGYQLTLLTHIVNGNAYGLIGKEYNERMLNRHKNMMKAEERMFISMYREGYSYSEISDAIHKHARSVIRMKEKLTNYNDDRCRLNVFNRSIKIKYIQVMTMYNKGYSKLEISNTLGYSRDYVTKIIRDGPQYIEDINRFRGTAKINKRAKRNY